MRTACPGPETRLLRLRLSTKRAEGWPVVKMCECVCARVFLQVLPLSGCQAVCVCSCPRGLPFFGSGFEGKPKSQHFKVAPSFSGAPVFVDGREFQ